MSLQWGDILDLYTNGCLDMGASPELVNKEKYTHATESIRRICAILELPELYMPDATFDTVANQDWVLIDPDVYSIHSIQQQSTGLKLRPEPGGFRGRMRYYEAGQQRPPLSNACAFYVRKGTKLYLRDTPNAILTFSASFRFHPPPVTSADLAEHPVTPQQYDMAIVKGAMGSYFDLHPPKFDGNPDPSYGRNLIEQSKQVILGDTKNPTAEEVLDTEHYTSLAGYDMGLSGR